TVSGGSVLARWTRDINGKSDLYLQTYFDRTIRIGGQLGETRNTLDVDFLHHIGGTRHDVRWGAGARWSPSRFLQKQPGIDLRPHNDSDHVLSGFLEDEIALSGNISLTVGSKLQDSHFGEFDVQPSTRLLWTA